MVQWINFGVLVLSTLLFLYFYVRSTGPAALEGKLGPRAYAVCTRYRIVASVLMTIATANYVVYFFYPLPSDPILRLRPLARPPTPVSLPHKE